MTGLSSEPHSWDGAPVRSGVRGLVRHVLGHPGDAIILARVAWRFRRDHWWRMAPFLPVPDPRYWHFRLITALGDGPGSLSARDAVAAATWALAQKSAR